MTLTVAIIANLTAILALIAGLAHVMSRARRLTPHVATDAEPAAATLEAGHRATVRRSVRSGSAWTPARSRQFSS
jgi:hypothetical protein